MKIIKDIVIADLESKYKKIVEEKNKERLFLKIADYGKYLVKINDYIDGINLSLIEDSQDDKKNFDISFKKFIKDWTPLSKDILILTKESNITDNPSNPFDKRVIQQLTEKLQDPQSPELLLGEVEYFYTPYRELIKKFNEKGKNNKLINKHIDKDGNILLYETYKNTNLEWENFKNKREFTVWWAHFNILRLSFGVFKLDGIENFLNPNRVLDSIYQYEFNQIAQGNTQDLLILNENKFRDWIDILHNYLIPRIKNISLGEWEKIDQKNRIEKLIIKPIPKNWSLYQSNNKLSIIKDEITIYTFLRTDSNKCKYFKKVWEGNGKKTEFDELYKSIGLSYPYKKGENNKINKSIRDTLRKLNKEFKDNNVPIKLIEKNGYRINFD